MSPRRLFRALAVAEAVTWTLLIVGMVLKYVTDTTELGVRIGGGLHGFVFLSYCLVVLLVGVDARWGAGRILTGLASAVVPYLTVPFEQATERAGLLPQRWRLRHEGGRGPADAVAGFVVRRPRAAFVIALAVVSAVFRILLHLGPPTEWGR